MEITLWQTSKVKFVRSAIYSYSHSRAIKQATEIVVARHKFKLHSENRSD